MKEQVERVSKWCYQGLWGVLTKWFNVPEDPPTLPTYSGRSVDAFQPSEGFLKYLKFTFWLMLFIIDIAILIAWIVITVVNPVVGIILAPIALFIAVVPDIVAYLAIHLRFDTTWYVLSDRSLRIRRGIWLIHETTITYENIQNVKIQQGPLQRWFDIADVLIETAGGGGSQPGHAASSTHCGLIEGVQNASAIREKLMTKIGQSKSAGLGDDRAADTESWTEQHVQALQEIRDLIAKRFFSSQL